MPQYLLSIYQPDGGVAIGDITYRPLQTSYSSVFRFAVKRLVVTRDEEAQAHTCHVTLDIAWEPRVQPLYLALERATIDFAKDGMRPTRVKWNFLAPVSSSNWPSVAMEKNLTWPPGQSAVKWRSILPVTASARFFK